MTHKLSIVTIVGRQNVGKSTLFNALIRSRKAIVDPRPGLTRDILSCSISHRGLQFSLVDTPGLDIRDTSELSRAILDNANRQLGTSTIIILLMEKPSPSPFDLDLIGIIRKQAKPTIIAVNKMDTAADLEHMVNFYEMGFNDILPLSAMRRINLDLLLDKIADLLPAREHVLQKPDIRIAIIGRPNSGKSTLLNAFMGYDRSVVSAIPGTTRDAVDDEFNYYGKRIQIIDTAGMRKKSRIQDSIDFYSVTRTKNAIRNADIAIHLIDATMGLTDTDKKISDEIVRQRAPTIIAINKWDLIPKNNKTFEEFREKLIFRFYKAADFPIISISAQKRVRIHKLIHTALELKERSSQRIETGKLNKLFENVQKKNRPPVLGNRLKILYGTQIGISPPVFKIWVNNPSLCTDSVKRFLEKHLQEMLNLKGVPIVLKIGKR